MEWSPVHPACFASVDGSGKLDIWDLNNNIEVSSSTYLNTTNKHSLNSNNLNSSSSSNMSHRTASSLAVTSSSSFYGNALNRLKWSRKGTEIAIGDDQGKIGIVEVGDSFVQSNKYEENLKTFKSTLDNFKQLARETKEYSNYDLDAFNSKLDLNRFSSLKI